MRRYRREARDIVHFQWLTVPRTDLRKLPERPVVLTIHDPLERGGVKPPLRPSAFGRVNAVVVHSEYARERVIAEHRLSPEKVHVIRHGAINACGRARTAAAGASTDRSPGRALLRPAPSLQGA